MAAKNKKTNVKSQAKSTPKSSGRKAPAGAAENKAADNRKPIRRGVGAFICLLLAVFAFIGYSNSDAVFISLMQKVTKGLFGSGFYVLPFVLLYCAFVLAFHGGRSVAARVVCSLITMVSISGMIHLIAGENLSIDKSLPGILWDGKLGAASGGFIGGYCAIVLTKFVSGFGAGAVFVISFIFLSVAASGHTPGEILSAFRTRPRKVYTQPPETERPIIEVQKPQRKSKPRPDNIDLPMGDIHVNSEPYSVYPEEEAPPVIIGYGTEKKQPNTGHVINPPAETVRKKPPPQAEKRGIAPGDAEDPELFINKKAKPRPPLGTDTSPDTTFGEDVSAAIASAAQKEQSANEYRYPPLSLLSPPTPSTSDEGESEVRANIASLERAFKSFGVSLRISAATRGPSVTRYEAELESGIKLSKVQGLERDIALALGAESVRIAAMPDKRSTVGIEVPNRVKSVVQLREIIESDNFVEAQSKLTFAIGKNIPGEAMVGNITKLPHLLIAGTTGSGKSVSLNSLILSILYKSTPTDVRMIMIDPKMVEFSIYNGIPHLLTPVVTDVKKASGALQWAVVEMEKRYHIFKESGVRDIETYNKTLERRGEDTPIFQLLVVIDELADLMMSCGKEVEDSIVRVAQKGRAAGVHLIIATQSPRADVITGLMKANIPSRIALQVASGLESRIILDTQGADKLVGNGDMLFAPTGTSRGMRIQGAWVSDEERENVVGFIKQSGSAEYEKSIEEEIERAAYADEKKAKSGKGNRGDYDDDEDEIETEFDPLLSEAAEVIFNSGQASTSWLQRRLRIGYARGARIIDQLETVGLLGPFEGSKARQILLTRDQWARTRYAAPRVTDTALGAPLPRDDDEYDDDSELEESDDTEDDLPW